MHHLATYFHGTPLLADTGLLVPAMLAVPVLGAVLMRVQQRRSRR